MKPCPCRNELWRKMRRKENFFTALTRLFIGTHAWSLRASEGRKNEERKTHHVLRLMALYVLGDGKEKLISVFTYISQRESRHSIGVVRGLADWERSESFVHPLTQQCTFYSEPLTYQWIVNSFVMSAWFDVITGWPGLTTSALTFESFRCIFRVTSEGGRILLEAISGRWINVVVAWLNNPHSINYVNPEKQNRRSLMSMSKLEMKFQLCLARRFD